MQGRWLPYVFVRFRQVVWKTRGLYWAGYERVGVPARFMSQPYKAHVMDEIPKP